MAPNQELYQRVTALSLKQREVLSQQLRQLGVELSSPVHSPQRLIAYVVATSELQPSDLRNSLITKLPNYMVPATIVPLPKMPRTANGKIDTNALPEPQLSISTLDETAIPRTTTEKVLAQIWSDVLGLTSVGIHDNFFELGGDSILSIQIVSRAREVGLQLAPNQLFEQPTVAELAAMVNLVPEVVATQDLVTGQIPLTPIQHWFFEQKMAVLQHWHQARLVEVPNAVSGDVMENVLSTLWTHHDALRLSFSNNQQINTDARHPPQLIRMDLSHLSDSEQIKAVADHGSRLHATMNLTEGGLMRAILFTRRITQSNWLLLSLHHLIVDAVSWQILLSDLSTLLRRGAQLPNKTTSFRDWAETLVTQTATRQSEVDFWLTQIEQPTVQLPRASQNTPLSIEGFAQTVTVALSAEDTQVLLQTVPAIYNTQINDVLLTALAQILLQWVDMNSGYVQVDMEAHGREHIADAIDVSRTVGWFTTIYPVTLKIDNANSCIDTLKSVKEQLRQVPARGIGYGLLRYLGDDETRQQLAQAKPSEVLFNYLGQQTYSEVGLRVIQDIDVGILRDPRNRRSYLLDVNAWVADGQLQVNWRYDSHIHHSDTLTTLANQYVTKLKSLIIDCTNNDSGGFTPSDFPDADLDQTELDNFISQLTEET